jgi:hypothetical protein
MLFLDGLCKKPADSVFHPTHWRRILGNLEGDRVDSAFPFRCTAVLTERTLTNWMISTVATDDIISTQTTS